MSVPEGAFTINTDNQALIIVIIVWFLGCLGLSDPTAANFRQAEILNVTFKSIAAHKHSYTVSWKPLQNIPFVEGDSVESCLVLTIDNFKFSLFFS